MDRYHDWQESGCGCVLTTAVLLVLLVLAVLWLSGNALAFVF